MDKPLTNCADSVYQPYPGTFSCNLINIFANPSNSSIVTFAWMFKQLSRLQPGFEQWDKGWLTYDFGCNFLYLTIQIHPSSPELSLQAGPGAIVLIEAFHSREGSGEAEQENYLKSQRSNVALVFLGSFLNMVSINHKKGCMSQRADLSMGALLASI